MNGISVVTATAKMLYCKRIAWTKLVGRYLTANIVIADVIITAIFLSFPKISFLLRTVYVTINIIKAISIFAKNNSSKLSRSNKMSAMNRIVISITSLAPSVNRSRPSTGPCALTSEENIIVKKVNMPPFLFMLELDD